jgi:hypothetical protein
MRTAADPLIVEMSKGVTAAQVDALCGAAVDQEYFAQLSQVIPLLLVAVGLEAGFFARSRARSACHMWPEDLLAASVPCGR